MVHNRFPPYERYRIFTFLHKKQLRKSHAQAAHAFLALIPAVLRFACVPKTITARKVTYATQAGKMRSSTLLDALLARTLAATLGAWACAVLL